VLGVQGINTNIEINRAVENIVETVKILEIINVGTAIANGIGKRKRKRCATESVKVIEDIENAKKQEKRA
jgi:hypothetical protein